MSEFTYNHYKNARNAAWQILIDNSVKTLPVHVCEICENLGVAVRSYKTGWPVLQQLGLISRTKADGFAIMLDDEPVIFYNGEKSEKRSRFTIAHELGHMVLGHIMQPAQSGLLISGPNREPSPNDAPEEAQANIFASRLLAPACVLWGLGVHTAEQIERFCEISAQSARFRMERMKELYQRNKFLTSPLEQQVYANFEPFIYENKL